MNRHPTTPRRSTFPDLSDQAHAKLPTCREPRQRGARLPPGRPSLTPQRDALQRGALGSGQARPPPGAAAPTQRLALGLRRGSAPAAAAPRPPGPRRLGGCRSGRWSRARGGRAGGKVRPRESSRSRPGSPGAPRGEWGPLRAGRVRRAARGASARLPCPPQPATSGRRVQRGGWCGARPPGVLPAGAAGSPRGGGSTPRGSGAARPRRGADARGRGGASQGGSGVTLASPTFLVAFSRLMTFSYTH